MRKYLSLIVIIISLVLLYIPVVHSAEEEKDRLLVVTLKAQKGIDQEEAVLLTDLLSVEIHRSGKFTILNRYDMKAVLDEKEFELAMGCDDNVCLLENVVKLAVNKIIAGNIGKLGTKYIISIRMINEDGENEVMVKETCDCAISELDKTIEQVAYKFLRYLDGDVAQDGLIRVESEPEGATIYLDGDNIGTTPDTITNLGPGTYEVVVKKEEHAEWSKKIDIEVSEEKVLSVVLQRTSEVYSSGDKYEGEFKDGERHGHGTYTWADGFKYVGEWKDGKRHGQGTKTFLDGRKYVGGWKDDKRHGSGTQTFLDGRKYEGGFKDGKFNGQGTHAWPDGSKYVGGWKDDEENGQGTKIWGSNTRNAGDRYVGEWKDGNESGGWYYLPDGSKMWSYRDSAGNWNE